MPTKMGFTCVVALSILVSNSTNAQSAWLSTPESLSAFRDQVESLKPAQSKIELSSIQELAIDLDDRNINIRIYE
jgi:hypothetical protein